MTPLANFLESADIAPLGATVAYLLRLADARGVRCDRHDILTAARELDWRIAHTGADEVVMPPATKPIRLTSSFEGV